ncbi:MAG: response regulator [Polyangiales bacterium]
MRVLVVEDDARVASFVARALTEEGFDVDVAHDGVDGERQARLGRYDLVVLDWTLPGMDGLAVLRTLRRAGVEAPVMMLTARDETSERVLGLDAGADDYVVKPFALEEFLARARALTRRGAGRGAATSVSAGGVTVDVVARRATLASGGSVDLTASARSSRTPCSARATSSSHRAPRAGVGRASTWAPTSSTCTCATCASSRPPRLYRSPRRGASAMPSRRSPRRRGSLRARLSATLALSFGVAAALAALALAAVESRALERQLDASLRAHADSEVLTAIDRSDGLAHLHDATVRLGADGDALEKYAALYDARGRVLAATSTFGGRAPPRDALGGDGPRDLWGGRARPFARWWCRCLLRRRRGRSSSPVPARRSTARSARWRVAAATSVAVLAPLGGRGGGALALAHARPRRDRVDGAVGRRGDLDARVGPVGGAEEVAPRARPRRDGGAPRGWWPRSGARLRRGPRAADAAHLAAGELELALRRPRARRGLRGRSARRAPGRRVDPGRAGRRPFLSLARARTAPSREESCDVVAACRAAARLVEAEADARGVRVEVEGGDVVAAVGARALERVVRNLVENAARFSPEGAAVRVRASRAGAEARVEVSDEGPGVPITQAERVFEPFVRLDAGRPREKGAGLGLAIARELARARGGDVFLDPTATRGARFVVTLPASS